jgi:hypothetical protein
MIAFVFLALYLTRVDAISMAVIYPLIPQMDYVYLNKFLCTATSSRTQITLIDTSNEIRAKCGSYEILELPILTSPELFASTDDINELPPFSHINKSHFHIRSPKYARIAMLLRNDGPNSGIDIFLDKINAADIVIVGSNIHTYPWYFFEHIFSATKVANSPLVVEFMRTMASTSFINFLIDIGYPSYSDRGYLTWASCVAVDDCLTSDCRECSWRQNFGNSFGEDSLDMLSKTARLANAKRNLYGDSFDCDEQFLSYLFHEDGLKVIEKVAAAAAAASRADQVHVRSPKILCMTYSTLARRDAIASVRDTWGGRCDGYLAFTDETDLTISAIGIEPTKMEENQWTESYDFMWQKTQLMWIIVASSRLIDEYDFFLAGGDDLFVEVENLREMLQSTKIKNLAGVCRC